MHGDKLMSPSWNSTANAAPKCKRRNDLWQTAKHSTGREAVAGSEANGKNQEEQEKVGERREAASRWAACNTFKKPTNYANDAAAPCNL